MRTSLADSGQRHLGLPAHALTIRNSIRTLAACPRRWWFKVGEGLEPTTEARALAYGTAWHACLEDVHRWWMDHDGAPYPEDGPEVCSWCRGGEADPTFSSVPCNVCAGTGLGPVASSRLAWDGTDREDDAGTLWGALDGWLRYHGRTPPRGMRVVAVEVPLAMPIVSPASKAGALYTPDAYWITRPDGTERPARTGEAHSPPPGCTVKSERRPVYLTARLDCVWEYEGTLMVGEWKSSRNPRTYLLGLSIDPQVTCYELVLQHAAREGLLWLPGPGVRGGIDVSATVSGWWYDVASSHPQRDPQPLKAGSFSRAKTLLASVPSWRLEAALLAAGEDLLAWDAELNNARVNIDSGLYIREPGGSAPEVQMRTLRENYALAREQVGHLRAAAEAESAADIDVRFPRRPICRMPGGHCVYRGPCLRDDAMVRQGFTAPEADIVAPDEEESPYYGF